MKIEIIKSGAKWLINGKPYNEVSTEEKIFFDEFIIAMRWERECEEFDKKLKQNNG